MTDDTAEQTKTPVPGGPEPTPPPDPPDPLDPESEREEEPDGN